MSLSKNLYELAAIANVSSKVVSHTSAILARDLRLAYHSSVLAKPLRDCDSSASMYSIARSKARHARKTSKRQYSTTSHPSSTRRYTSHSRAYSTVKSSHHAYSTNSLPQFHHDPASQFQHATVAAVAAAAPSPPSRHSPSPASAPVPSSPAEKQPPTGSASKDHQMSSSEVPSTRLARIFHYGSLAAGLGIDVARQGIKHYATGNNSPLSMKSLILSPANIERMAKKFSKMRGAALKVGQMLSFQDSSILPAEIQQILLRVQNSAHYMPPQQLERVMKNDLGSQWRKNHFSSFDDVPIAAASIGQVHTAVTNADLTPVVVKVQYPGVVDSIDSDLNNLLMLMTASSMLPPGLFLDKTIANARTELKWECDYIREAQNLIRFRELLKNDGAFTVPRVYHNLCGEHVLTMERMQGTEIAKGNWSQDTRDWIATNIMRLCLQEIAQFKFMQTDPNWANFLYNEKTGKIELLDFGASREFGDEFIADYVQVLRASVRKDRAQVEHYSKRLGYLTGLETPGMIEAHVDSVMVLGECFSPADNHGQSFNFKKQTITDRVRDNIGTMLQERLTPPPEETYSLHRKLSGVYLLCARLGATVPCEQLFKDIVGYD